MELVQITAQYSNAVLVALMPYVSDFAKKLELPISVPVIANDVREFKCDPRREQAGGLLILGNGYRFAFFDGRVTSYSSPWSFFSLQDPARVPEFYGRLKVDEKRAQEIAQDAVDILGYSKDANWTNLVRRVTSPEKIGTNYIARNRVQWLDTSTSRSRVPGGGPPVAADVEVDATRGQIQMLSISSALARRKPLEVEAPATSSEPGPGPSDEGRGLSGGMKTLSVAPTYAAAFLEAILPQISDFEARIGLPLESPLTTNDVDASRYLCRLLDGQPIAQLFLKNGDRFNYEHGHVSAFYAHDAYNKFPGTGRVEDFLGTINMTTNEAIALCERAIKKLGYRKKLPKATFLGHTYVGAKEFSRYMLYWLKSPGSADEIASFEVDVETKMIRSVYFDDLALWRDPPKIEIPSEASR